MDDLNFPLNLRVSTAELEALASMAQDELRDTRSQALYLIRMALKDAGYFPITAMPARPKE